MIKVLETQLRDFKLPCANSIYLMQRARYNIYPSSLFPVTLKILRYLGVCYARLEEVERGTAVVVDLVRTMLMS